MASNRVPQIGAKGTATLRVGPEHTAQAFASGDVPVFSTPRLVALLEEAAVRATSGVLAPEDTTVGTRIAIAHLAATPIGRQVRAEAEIVGIDARKLTFAVAAFDATERIAEGTHERAIVNRAKFLERVRRKAE